MNRRSFVTQVAAASGLAMVFGPAMTHGQRSRVRHIGLVVGDDPEGGVTAFKEALRQLGFVQGENLAIEERSSLRSGLNVAAEIARSDVELVVAQSLPSALAVRAANPAMRLVIVTTPGLISNGFAKTLERPGGNATGIDELPPGVTGRRLELLKTAAPGTSRVALLSTTPGQGGHEAQLADAEKAAVALGVSVKPYRATRIAELDPALAAIASDGMNGLLNFQGGLSYVNRQKIVDFAASRRLPAIYQATVFATAGGLMTWAPDLVDQFRTAAGYVAQILRGANPGDLPIKYPSRYYLTLNNGAAAKLDLTFPQVLVTQAHRVLS